MEIDANLALEKTYGRWNRNHPVKNDIGMKVNQYVLHLAVSQIWPREEKTTEEILFEAQDELKLSQRQTEKLLEQATLIADQVKHMSRKTMPETQFAQAETINDIPVPPSEPSWAYTPIPPQIAPKRIEKSDVQFPQTTEKDWSAEYFYSYLQAISKGESHLLPSWNYPDTIFIDQSFDNVLENEYKKTAPGSSRKIHIQRDSSVPIRVKINRGWFSERISLWTRKYLGHDAALSPEDLHHLACRDKYNPLLVTVTSAATSLFFRARDSELVDGSEPVYPGMTGPNGNYIATKDHKMIMYVKNRDEDIFRKINNSSEATK